MTNVGEIITPEDLTPFGEIDKEKAKQLIADAEAMAKLVAPCLKEQEFRDDEDLMGAAKAILRGAILRKNDAGTGVVANASAGNFQIGTDTRSQQSKTFYWPSEIAQLRELCAEFNKEREDQAFMVDMVPEVKPSLYSRPDLWLQYGEPTP